jgi:hypothetical protein
MPEVLAQCQRYYWKTFAPTTKPAQGTSALNGVIRGPQTVAASTANNGGISQAFPVTMRDIAVTVTTYNPINANAQAYNVTTATDCSATSATTSQHAAQILFTSPGASAAGNGIIVHATAESEL